MTERQTLCAARQLLLCLALLVTACGPRAERPGPPVDSAVADPRTVLSFATLYGLNCAGCHGTRGLGGAAAGLASPRYLAWVSDADLHRAIAEGRPKTAMPAFAHSAGGTLSEPQVEALVAGIRSWAAPGLPLDASVVPYEPPAEGDPERGARVFSEHCAVCHGADGSGGKSMGSIVSEPFLELVSEQSLRTTVVAGRQDVGCPGFRSRGGAPSSADDVSDTVAWLWDHRKRLSGRPHRSARAADQAKP